MFLNIHVLMGFQTGLFLTNRTNQHDDLAMSWGLEDYTYDIGMGDLSLGAGLIYV